jgi:hypothetical protein
VEDLLLEQELLFVIEHAADGSTRPRQLRGSAAGTAPAPKLGNLAERKAYG